MDALGRHPESGDPRLKLLLKDIREGMPEAGRQLVQLYGPLLLRVVRSRIEHRFRRRFDSADFTQAVWQSFFSQASELQFRTEAELVAYLSKMARNKVAIEQRTGKSERRDVQAEVVGEPAAAVLQHLRSPDPTPSAVMTAVEEQERLVESKGEMFRRAMALRVSGHSHDEIATQLGVTVRTIERFFAVLRTEVQKCRNT